MRHAGSFVAVLVLGFSLLALSCGVSSYEHQGDAAYARARKLQGDEKTFAQRQAYQLYLLAIKKHPESISYQLRSRFIELSIARAQMILSLSDPFTDPLQFFIEDIDTFLTGEIPSAIKQEYAMLLVQIADSLSARDRCLEGLPYFDKAITYASDRGAINGFRARIVAQAVRKNLDTAAQELAAGADSGKNDALVRAEYYTEAALVFDSSSADAKKLLSDCRKKTIGICCDYRKVLKNLPDTLLFRKVETNSIFLAVPSLQGGGTALTVLMSNFSNGALDLKQGDFFLVDISGKRYRALEADKDIELLDQYRQARFALRFPKPATPAARLVFEKGTRYGEKWFF